MVVEWNDIVDKESFHPEADIEGGWEKQIALSRRIGQHLLVYAELC